jgi:hypothetical protein
MKKLAIILISILAAAALVAVRWYVGAHTMPAAHPCVNTLAVIDGCKQQWTLEYSKTTNDVPSWADLRPYLPDSMTKGLPRCPAGGSYMPGRVGEPPRCSLGERDPLYHSLPH